MKKIILLAIALLLLTPLASASVITLTFEGLGDQTPIGNYYNGGPGGNYGISFGPDSLSIICAPYGGSGNCDHPPTAGTIAFFLTGPGDVMNVAGGFTTGFSFYYAAPVYAGSVSVYDGLNGTGSLLASLYLPLTPGYCNSPYTYSCWVPIGVAFGGTAQSVVFSGVANFIGFDNITLGRDTPGNGTIPEPGTMILLGTGLIAIARKLRK